jgi:starch phosphorylase
MRHPEIPTGPTMDLEIPLELSRLSDLAYNLWWTWSPEAHVLFHSIHPARWRHYHNPIEVLRHVEPARWDRLLLDRTFVRAYEAVVQEFDDYVARAGSAWFPRTWGEHQGGPVAYFSTEYGWHECLGVYSGGLGVLSGDTCKSASDLGIPFVGVGLMYRRGYFQQTIDAEGTQQHVYPDLDVHRLPLRPVAGRDGKPLRVGLELPGRRVLLGAWKVDVGRAPVLLLDTDVPENHPADRSITSFLYVRGREMRLCQEIVLGIGGVRVLEALGIAPSVWHMNEGHSAFLAIERIRGQVRRNGIAFAEALRRTAGNALFTTHTPVPAGNEVFATDLVRRYLEDAAAECGVAAGELLALGRANGNDAEFNLTALAIRTSSRTNGVSALHGRVADAMWKGLAPAGGRPGITHVTNGVHTPSWAGPEIGGLLRRELGGSLDEKLLDPAFPAALTRIPEAALWAAHEAQKRRLLTFTRDRLQDQFARHGRSPGELREVQEVLDPAALTLGFARRFATYKRANLLFRDRDRLRAILGRADCPVQIVFAGKAHPADLPGRELIRDIVLASQSADLRGKIVFLENYDMRVARHMVQGVDVWINTPRRPLEASGTSGMKAAVNGGLNLSILDGWWCEGYDPSHGWAIGRDDDGRDPETQDREDAEALYALLENEVVPCFYRRNDAGLPTEWIARMKAAILQLAPRFSSDRMMREYAESLYLPASRREGWGSEMDEVQCWAP